MIIEEKKDVTLTAKGDNFVINQKDSGNHKFKATLKWKSSVDLDLYCLYKLKGANPNPSFIEKIKVFLFGDEEDLQGTINYGNKGSENRSPFIRLDEDSGIGDTGGDNEENIFFGNIDKIESAIIVANIYNRNTNFAQYNSSVSVQGGDKKFTVPLSETKTGSWCVVAKIDNKNGESILTNINETLSSKPKLNNY